MSIIDTPNNTKNKLSCLLSQGVKTIIRYYNFSNSQSLPEKCLKLDEAQAIVAQGLEIAVVFQQRQDSAEDFSKSTGIAAGRRAFRHAHDSIGQPTGSGLYFAVDFDPDASVISSRIIPFFEGVREAFDMECYGGPGYRVGVYGSGLLCDTLVDKGLATLRWLSMSRGFRGTQDALKDGRYHLAQRYPEARICGISVDYNDGNPAMPDFGAFTIAADRPTLAMQAGTGERYRVTARNGLRLREGPGSQFDIIGGLQSDQIVVVVSIAEGWALLDLEGDGRVDGYASAGFLERL
ncbi:DUF1906 domain-containing protein [Desulfovibrio aerotolerans]|uniref:DUF1906 domain-containing protein n=1 Tax=Solidesulfovibrio aerotolerans TaxID=295255 RepID=A0A7C9MKP0_9BACT|nr:glycoside hydrolase domain-containing protein [Solidesulfovibrio aerotolerans]MYL84828.1 DUF1906 domain-containing protein [Solidesulfovibrio aerotolerans]